MTQITGKHFAIEVPEDATNIEICNYGENDTLEYMHHIDGIAAYAMDDLPPGTWRFLFATGTATEEDARTVVERYGKGWKDYNIYHAHKHIPYGLAIDSLETLLRSKGLDENKNYAIIEKL